MFAVKNDVNDLKKWREQMKRFLIWGLKWACFCLCGFALWESIAYATVSANSLAYDENSSSESDESYTDNNDYTKNSFSGSNSTVKNFTKPSDNDKESYSESSEYEQSDGTQEVADSEPETGLKAIQGFGKKSKENSENEEEIIANPYGVYYTTPQCEKMDVYLGNQCNDSMLFVICKDPDSDNSAFIRVTADINSDLDDTIQLKFNSKKERWEGSGNTLLLYDTGLEKYIFSSDKVRICLESITMESASLYNASHRSDKFKDIPLEGEFVSETGMNNGLTVYINEIFNTNYYYIFIATNDETITAIGEKISVGQNVYNNCTVEIGGDTYYIYGEDEDENGIANTIHMFTLNLDGNDVEYTLHRSTDDFDTTLNQDIYAGTYTVEDLNAVINLQYNKESESFYYNISIDGKKIDTSSTTAVCTGLLGYQLMSTDFIMNYTDYIMSGYDIKITIPSISPEVYSCTFESLENSADYYRAYQYVLEDTYENYGEACQYALYDIDNDGVKELIVSEGTCNANWTNDVYCVNENGLALLIGSFARTVVLYEATDGNGIYAVWGNQGLEEVTRITKNGSELEEELILSDSISYDEDYITYPNEIMTACVNDYSLLEG